MVLPRRRMAVTSKGVWTARSGLATTGSTAMALVGKKSLTAVRTSSRDQREMKGARRCIAVVFAAMGSICVRLAKVVSLD